jgi:hypothetical protein
MPRLSNREFFPTAKLPYNLRTEDVKIAMTKTYMLLNLLNTTLVNNGYDRLEELLLTNAFAGFLSEVLVRNLAQSTELLARNRKVGGHPDLIPKGKYAEDSVLMGEGIEVKTSLQSGGWQGHNPEKGWLMVFQYSLDIKTKPKENRNPTEFLQVLAAELESEDWNFSGRTGRSRRTITASINSKGMVKLRSNPIFIRQDLRL